MQGSKLLLVEDSSVLAERMVELIREIPEIDLVGVVDSEESALLELKKHRVHLLVLDLHLKEGTGFGILRAVNRFQQKPHVLVLTNHDSEAYEKQAIEMGASAFLDKARNFDRLPAILRELVTANKAANR